MDTHLINAEIQDCLVHLLPTVDSLECLGLGFFFLIMGLSAVWSTVLKIYQEKHLEIIEKIKLHVFLQNEGMLN